MPVLSIITVAAFDSNRLEVTLNSITPILSEFIEHVVVYPESDQESTLLLNSNLHLSPFRKIFRDSGQGIYPAMNIGISKCVGDYCWFLNCGDELVPDNITSLIEMVNFQRPAWLIGQGLFEWREDQLMCQDNLMGFISLRGGAFISHQTVIVRRTLLSKLDGFDTRFKVAADTDLLSRLVKITMPVWFLQYIARVETPNFASVHNRRARFEILKLALQSLSFETVYHVLKREFISFRVKKAGEK